FAAPRRPERALLPVPAEPARVPVRRGRAALALAVLRLQRHRLRRRLDPVRGAEPFLEHRYSPRPQAYPGESTRPEYVASGNKRMDQSPVVVIGAGPAGLTAAYELVKEGRQVVVLEKDGRVGGISRTEEYKGYKFDIGGHRFFTKVDEVRALWHEVMGDDFIEVARL